MVIDNVIQSYVLGLAFDNEGNNVVLIKKNRPAFQAGLLNGVGGKVEPDEFGSHPSRAMVREFREETAVQTEAAEWKQIAVLNGEDYRIHVFTAFDSWIYDHAMTNTDESIIKIPVSEIKEKPLSSSDPIRFMDHVEWLVKLALVTRNTNTKVTVDLS